MSIKIRNKFNKGTALTGQLELIRENPDATGWYLSKTELKRLEKLVVGGDKRKEKKLVTEPQWPSAKSILESGKAAGRLPEGVVIRVWANLEHSVPADEEQKLKEEAKGVDFAKNLRESWEFTADQVHRIEYDDSGKAGVRVRAESRPFDSKGLCKELLEGKVLSIGKGEGTGEAVLFFGTNYEVGGRFVEVFKDGDRRITVGESCIFGSYAESDARAFAALYEKLAKQARAAFAGEKG